GSVSVRRAGLEVDRHAAGRIDVADAGIRVADDGVVAAQSLEFVEGKSKPVYAGASGIGAGGGEAAGIVAVDETGAADRLDRAQGVGADRGIAGHGAGGEMNRDPRCCRRIQVVDRPVEPAAAVDEVVAGAAVEILRGTWRVVA